MLPKHVSWSHFFPDTVYYWCQPLSLCQRWVHAVPQSCRWCWVDIASQWRCEPTGPRRAPAGRRPTSSSSAGWSARSPPSLSRRAALAPCRGSPSPTHRWRSVSAKWHRPTPASLWQCWPLRRSLSIPPTVTGAATIDTQHSYLSLYLTDWVNVLCPTHSTIHNGVLRVTFLLDIVQHFINFQAQLMQ